MITRYLNSIICDDAFRFSESLPDDSVDLIVTSPPYYGLRDYDGSSRDAIGNELHHYAYVERLVDLMCILEGKIKPTGSIFVNLGDRALGGLMMLPYRFAIDVSESTGLIVRNHIAWTKTNPSPTGNHRMLVSAHEPVFHFVKGDYKFHVDRYLIRGNSKQLPSKPIGMSYYDKIDSSDLSQEEKQMARDELTQAIAEYMQGEITGIRMKIRGVHALPFGGKPGGRMKHIENKGFTLIKLRGNSIKRNVIETSVANTIGIDHPAVYPESLVKELVALTTDEGDIVYDPFVGSGTTSVVAKRMGRQYIGVDISEKYCNISRERLSQIETRG